MGYFMPSGDTSCMALILMKRRKVSVGVLDSRNLRNSMAWWEPMKEECSSYNHSNIMEVRVTETFF